MEENLIGFALMALDPAEHQEVEDYLKAHPEAQERLDLLCQALVPLEAADEDFDPPADLRIRTLARVAEFRTRELLSYRVPAPPPRPLPPPRTWWRRADVLIAASILLLASSLVFPGLNMIRSQYSIKACQNNLRGFYQALMAYSDNHMGALPMAEGLPPHDFAGIMVPMLRGSGYLTGGVSVNCSAGGSQPGTDLTVESLDAEMGRDRIQYEKDVFLVGGSYAYPLGYRQNNHHYGLRRVPGYDMLPIMADRPPFTQQWGEAVWSGNSLNHGGKGQNVLFLGGRVIFATTRNVGIDNDDPYVNEDGLPRPGRRMADSVLVPGWFRSCEPDN